METDPQAIGEVMQEMEQKQPEQQPNQGNSTKALSLWKASGITLRHREFKPENSVKTEWSTEWGKLNNVLGKGVLAVIIGTRGSGKTQLATCAIRESCKAERSAKYVKALNFFLAIRATYKDKEQSEDDVLLSFCDPFLLVIDAIENRSESPFENLLLNHLIDMRYDRCKDTILISNQNEKEFAASMGLSIIDRIHECGIKIVCNWESFRRY